MSQKLAKRYAIDIMLKSPLHINSGDDREGYRSVTLLEGKPIIPASTLKGKMRDNFASLIENSCKIGIDGGKPCSCPVCLLFGSAGYQPSRVYVQNLEIKDFNKEYLKIRTGTAVDRYLRVVRDQALFKTQVVDKGIFTGEMEVYFNPVTIEYESMIILSLKMIETIGGGKSRGLGFVDVEVKSIEKSTI